MSGFENLPEKIRQDKKVTRLVINAALNSKSYAVANNYINILENKGELSITDLFNKGCIASLTKDHDNAIIIYQQVLKRNKHYLPALNNIAGELIEQGAYLVAQRALDKAFKVDANFYPSYITMAYAKILQGQLSEAKALIDKCLELNIQYAEAYKTLGIYYLKLTDVPNAKLNFNKAITLNQHIDVETYLEQLEKLTGVIMFAKISSLN